MWTAVSVCIMGVNEAFPESISQSNTVLSTLKWIQYQTTMWTLTSLSLPTVTSYDSSRDLLLLNINTEKEDHPLPDQAYLLVCQSLRQALRYQVTLQVCVCVRECVYVCVSACVCAAERWWVRIWALPLFSQVKAGSSSLRCWMCVCMYSMCIEGVCYFNRCVSNITMKRWGIRGITHMQ